MELTEQLLIYVFFGGVICYLAYGCYKLAKDMVAYANDGNRISVIVCAGAILFMISGIVLGSFTIYATWQGNMPEAFYPLKSVLRPVFSIITSAVVLFFAVGVTMDLVLYIKARNRKGILITVGKMIAVFGVGAWLLIEKWQWILE